MRGRLDYVLRRFGWRKRGVAQLYPLDALAWAVAIPFAALLRYDMDAARLSPLGVALMVVAAAAAQAVLGVRHGLYTGRWRTGSFDEMSGLSLVVGSTTLCVVVVDVLGPRLIPLSAAIGSGAFALLIASAIRYAVRWTRERGLRPSADHASRVVVFGAGSAGNELVQAMLRTPTSPYLPVALLDDDPGKARLRICGIPVRGTREQLADVVAASGATRRRDRHPRGTRGAGPRRGHPAPGRPARWSRCCPR